jgi:hypothetical protein
MKIKLKFLVILIFLVHAGLAQKSNITGIVTDKTTGEAVLFAHLYLANTTIGTTSNASGEFLLENIPSGQFTLVCTMVGYDSYLHEIDTEEGDVLIVKIELNPSLRVLHEVELTGKEDRKWKRQFKLFERELFGDMPNASRCEIINPWVVDFEVEGFHQSFRANAEEPMIIYNKVLGYKISFLLKRFEIDRGQFIYTGYPSFEILETTDWDSMENSLRNREETFLGSTRHFFYALLNDKLDVEGFKVYRASHEPNQQWPDRLSEAVNYGYLRQLEASDIVKEMNSNGNYQIFTDDFLEIIYTRKPWNYSPYLDAPYQVSRIKIMDKLMVARHGYVYNPYAFVVYGYLSEERVANILPFEYGLERISD